MNSTMAILKGLSPAYIRIGSADTAKYTFKKTRHLNDMIKPEDEYTVTGKLDLYAFVCLFVC